MKSHALPGAERTCCRVFVSLDGLRKCVRGGCPETVHSRGTLVLIADIQQVLRSNQQVKSKSHYVASGMDRMDRMVNCTECHNVFGSFMTFYHHYPFTRAHSSICDILAAHSPTDLRLVLALRALSRSRWINAHDLGTEPFGDIRDKGAAPSRAGQEQHATRTAMLEFHEIASLTHVVLVYAS